MSCAETQELIHAYVDRELDLAHNLEIERHLRECPACAAFDRRLRALQSALKQGSLYFEPPQGLEGRVRSRLHRTGAVDRPARTRRMDWRWAGIAAALFLSVLTTWRVAIFLHSPSAAELLTDEVASSHVRSLMAAHLTDVPSSDRHTVKPWFNGKLDFSPAVQDFAASGFPLVGGRLDYLNHRSVAALVYQRRQHVINLFVWPAPDASDAAVQTANRQGYHVVHWTRSHMNYWAASDLNPAELDAFAEMYREAVQ
jgi:anti-sigma factor RsiW